MSLASTAATITIAAIAMLHATPSSANAPICLLSDSDSDGDGWGWENNQSCVTSNNSASSTVEIATSDSEQRASRHPLCVDANTDPDGDGWGWEDNQSCRIEVTTQSVVAANENADAPSAPALAAETRAAADDAEFLDIINGLYRGTTQICSSRSSDIDGDGWGFEFHNSCKVIAGYVAPGSVPQFAPDGNTTEQAIGVVYQQDFNTADIGLYQADQLNNDWQAPNWHLGFDQGRVSIVDTDGSRGNAMQVTYPAGRYGAGGASAFLSDVQFGMKLPETYEELYVAYDIRFAEGFDFVKGGKLPGLCGSDINQAPNTGCNTGGGYPSGYDGWSARGMWREDGILENYVYHASQRNFYGDDEFWDVSATPGVWHRVQHRVVLNTPGQKNGILEAWFDGTKVLSLKNLEYRKTNTIGINLFYFSTFFGGNDASWAPSTDQTMNFDNFVLSTDPID